MKTKNRQQDKFQIIFDGSAFSEGTIQARVFANSLLALDDIFSAIVKEKHGKEAEIHLQITAIKPGSFLVDILCSLPQDIWEKAITIFTSKDYQAIKEIIGLIFGSGGIFALYKWLKGRDYRIDKDTVKIIKNKKEIDAKKFPPEVISASQRLKTIKAMIDFVTPLKHEGYDVIKLKYRNKGKKKEEDIDLEIKKNEREFYTPTYNNTSEEQTRIYNVKWVIVTASLEGEYKWRFRDDDGNTYTASILDETFKESIADGSERFGRDDYLECQIREESKIENGMLRRFFYVEKVIKKFKQSDNNNLLQ